MSENTMQLSGQYVGLKLSPYHTAISERQSMNYAAGAGDANPLYFDDEADAGQALLAPPMLATALTWQVAGRIWDFLPPGGFPVEVLLTQVHYGEHLLFHQPLRPGMRLSIEGEIAAILPHRAGTLVTLRFDANLESGAPVFTEFATGLLRGVVCEGEGRGGEGLPVAPQVVGGTGQGASEAVWEERVMVDRLAPYIFDGCADVHFPIHSSPRFAHQVGLPGVILQGTASLAYAQRLLVDRQAGGQAGRLKELACRFGAFVLPGGALTVRLLASRPAGEATWLAFDVLNSEGKPAIRDGFARLDGGDG